MSKIIYWQNKNSINLLQKSISQNIISVITTDTILGLVAPITQEGFSNLNSIKSARNNKPYILLISSPLKLNTFVETNLITDAMQNVINGCWPGTVTIIFKSKSSLPFYMKSQTDTIAIRCPNHKELNNLLSNFDALFSTSANKSSEPVPTKHQDIVPEIITKIDYIVLDKKNLIKNQPSTIIDFSEAMNNYSAPIRVIREGAYPIKELEKHYGQKF